MERSRQGVMLRGSRTCTHTRGWEIASLGNTRDNPSRYARGAISDASSTIS
jgi:hypothetical protein